MTPLTPADEQWLHRAIDLAEKGLYTTTPNPRVGCVIRQGDETIGEGWHIQSGGDHAEVIALKDAAARGKGAEGAEVFISLEPCAHQGKTPPCTKALIDAKVGRVVAAMPDPNPQVDGGGFAALQAAGIAVAVAPPHHPARQRAEQINIGFISRMKRNRPWLRLKIAASLDGKTAVHSGLSRWISGEEARQDAHHLRACSCAILTGIGTALQDDPQLTVRHVDTPRQPLRVLVDSTLRAGKDMKLFADDNILVATAVTADAAPADFPAPVTTLPTPDGKVDLHALMEVLRARQINEVLVECGRQLNGALLAEGLADEIVLYIAARVFGQSGKDMFNIPAPDAPDAAPAFVRREVTPYPNGDIKIVYQNQHALDACLTDAS